MTTIYFVRHGEYKNPDNIVPWRLPHFPLSNKGKKNINKDAEYFKNKNIEIIYSSPVLRAKQSAKILADKLNKKVVFSSLISEVYTPLQSRHISYKEFFEKRTYPFLDDFHIKNKGESIEKIFFRMEKLVKKVLKKYPNKNVIFVSHGDPIMIYVLTKTNHKISSDDLINGKNYIPKAGIFELRFENIELINVNFHNNINRKFSSRTNEVSQN